MAVRKPTDYEQKVESNKTLMLKMFTKTELAYQLARINVMTDYHLGEEE